MKKITAYYHASKEALYDVGQLEGLSGEALNCFIHAEEMEIVLTVDENGWVRDAEVSHEARAAMRREP